MRSSNAVPVLAPPRWGSLKVVTTNMLPGWLRRNGVPYSQDAVITENFTRFTNPDAGDWFVVTTTVEDPQIPGAAVHHELEFQEGSGRGQVESAAL